MRTATFNSNLIIFLLVLNSAFIQNCQVGKQTDVLESTRNAELVDFMWLQTSDINFIEINSTRGRRVNAGNYVENSCFSRSVRPN